VSTESEGDVVAELETNCNLGKTITSVCPAWRCPHQLEHLISHEAPRSAILSDAAGTDVPLLRTFLDILSGNRSKYDSDDIDYCSPPHMCYHMNGEVLAEEAPRLTPLD
jgi:hypothetical protein